MHWQPDTWRRARVPSLAIRALSTAVSGVVAVAVTGCSPGDVGRATPGATTQPVATTTALVSTAAPSTTSGPTTAPVDGSTAPAQSTGSATRPPSVPGWPAFESSVQPVNVARLGKTWRAGCPVGPDELRLVRVSHATPDGETATGELIVAADAANDVIAAFVEIYEARFPITQMRTIDAYAGDDDASMADDNTSAFNCRPVTGGTGWSRHSYGLAIDINPVRNPYVINDTVLPPAGQAYLDRSDVRAGMIVAGDVVVLAFTSRGFEWGGDFDSLRDYQHFAR